MCRYPPRCWFCGRSGHISPFCQDKKQRTLTKLNILDSSSFPPLPPPRTHTLAATHTSAQHTQRIRMVQRYCRPKREPEHCSRVDDEGDRVRGCPRRRESLGGVSRWSDNRRSRAPAADCDRRGGWFRGESSRHRRAALRRFSPPPSRDGSSFEEKCALRRLWAESEHWLDSSDDERALQELMCTRSTNHILNNVDNNTSFPHTIIIEPIDSFDPLQQQTIVNDSGNTTNHVQVEEDNSLFLSPKSATPDLEAIQNFRLSEAIEIRPISCLNVTRM
jgi:hypothetical protein